MEKLLETLKSAVAGDDAALSKILDDFKRKAFNHADVDEIIFYIRNASKNSHQAIYIQALFYHCGYGVPQDFELAFITMRDAAARGNVKAMFEMGRRFLEGIGVDKNYDSALQWLMLAARSPHYNHDAMHALAYMYDNGLGVEADPEKAREWEDKAK